jgi:hypothetical protein
MQKNSIITNIKMAFNKLPDDIKDKNILTIFKKHLKFFILCKYN